MSRWHKVFCDRPDILVDADTNIPRCRTCDSMPKLVELILEQSKTVSPWSPPTEPPRGQWDLWSPLVQPNTERAVNISPSEPQVTDPPLSPIYKEQLNKNEFRLLCLSKAESAESPIHVDLEKHDDEFCPEYETVSYTWGGEDDDTRRQTPVYVGLYWDVLLQTKNCASMLHYVRSRRASQFLWVDAICINQEDPIDRAAQVSKMSSIYRNCRRVIVYLGIEEPHPKTYRPRQPLAIIRIEQLMRALRTRYFSRVWVIQELLLPPEAVIPINDVDYLVDHRTASILDKRNSSWDWHTSSAPWLQHMTAGAPFLKNDIFKALKQTCSSKATDPRDKVYGVLGLLKQDKKRDSNKLSITPNYSISFLEIFVGLCIHYLSTRQNASLFLKAAKWPSILPYPSWVPDWRVPTIWDGETHTDYSDPKEILKFTKTRFFDNPFTYMIYASSLAATTGFCGLRQATISEWRENVAVITEMGGICLKMTHLLDIDSHLRIIEDEIHGSARTIHIQGTSAALYFCTQQFSLERVVKTVKSGSQVSLFFLEIEFSEEGLLWFLRKEGATYSLVSCCRCYSLYLLAPQKTDTQYLEERNGFASLFEHILVDTWDGSWERSKMKTPDLDFVSPAMPISLADNVFNGFKLGFVNLNPLASNISAWWKSKQNELFCPTDWEKEDQSQRVDMRLIFPCLGEGPERGYTLKFRDVLPIYQTIIDDNEPNGEISTAFGKNYSNFVTERCFNYHPKIQDGMVTFTYNQEQWIAWEKFVSEFASLGVIYAVRNWQVQWKPNLGWETYSFQKAPKQKGLRLPLVGGGKSSTSISLRTTLRLIIPTLCKHRVVDGIHTGGYKYEKFFNELLWLKSFSARFKQGLTVTDLLEGNFVIPHDPTYVNDWHDSIAKELGLDGSIKKVTIL